MKVSMTLMVGALVVGVVLAALLMRGLGGGDAEQTDESPASIVLGSLAGANEAEVRARLGAPDDIARLENAEPAEIWTYPISASGDSAQCTNLVVSWSRERRVIGAERQSHPCARVTLGATE